MQDEPKQTIPEEEVVAKYTIKDSVLISKANVMKLNRTRRKRQLFV